MRLAVEAIIMAGNQRMRPLYLHDHNIFIRKCVFLSQGTHKLGVCLETIPYFPLQHFMHLDFHNQHHTTVCSMYSGKADMFLFVLFKVF